MVYPIVVYGHPVLRRVAEDIREDHPALRQLIDNMFETLYRSEGIGLAAPQIGKPVRLFIIDAASLAEDEPHLAGFKKVFINAHITGREGDMQIMNEGCLSIPGLKEEVSRESTVHITYYDEEWNYHEERYDGHIARVIQHEYDHLDGILFTDKVNPLRKKLLLHKLNAISKGRFEASYQTILPGQKAG